MPDDAKPRLPVLTDFKLILSAVLTLTLVTLGVDVLLTYVPARGNDPKSLADSCSTAFKLGMGAVFGLLGGRATTG